MSSDARSRRSIQSTIALSELLRRLPDDDVLSVDKEFLEALKSQSHLANYSRPELGIRAMSLNALKRASSACLPEGFSGLDLLRRNALAKLRRATDRKHESNSTSDAPGIQELKEQLRTAHEDLWNMSALLQRSMRQSRGYVDASRIERLQALCAKEQAEIYSGLSLIKSRPR